MLEHRTLKAKAMRIGSSNGRALLRRQGIFKNLGDRLYLRISNSYAKSI